MLTAGALRDGVFESAIAGVPQGGVASPLLSNIYLTVFDERMAEAGFALTRYADDWLIVCRSRTEAERALASARAVLEGELGLPLHPEKTRIVHITRGFEFLGYKVGRGKGLRHKAGGPSLYALPTDRSIKRFKDKVRTATNRRNPKDLEGVLAELNPIVRGWGNYYRRAKVRRAVSPPQPLDRVARLGATNTSTGETPDGVTCRSGGSTGSWDWSTSCN